MWCDPTNHTKNTDKHTINTDKGSFLRWFHISVMALKPLMHNFTPGCFGFFLYSGANPRGICFPFHRSPLCLSYFSHT